MPTSSRPQPRPSTPLNRTNKVSELVAREIVHDISRQELSAGTMLPPEKVLLQRYGISRASLREALRLLELQGVIRMRAGAHGGPMVAEIDERNFGNMATLFYHLKGATIAQLLEARLFVEPTLARLAAGRPKRELAPLRDYLRTMGTDSPDLWMEESTDFHDVVANVTGNHVLALFGTSLKAIYTARLGRVTFTPAIREQIAREHAEIGATILEGRADDCEKLMRQHMKTAIDEITRQFRGIMNEVVDWA